MAAKPQAAQTGLSLDRLPPVAKAFVGLVFMVLVGALYFVIFYGDLESEITSAKQREAQLAGDLSTQNASKEAYQKDLEEKTRREQLAREQKKILPDDAETPTFLAQLQQAATISGVNLSSWSPIEEIPAQFYAKVPMKLALAGKFHQVVKFFHTVGQQDRIINIEDIQIKAPPKVDSDEVEIKVECLATAFRALRTGETAADKQPRRQAGGGH